MFPRGLMLGAVAPPLFVFNPADKGADAALSAGGSVMTVASATGAAARGTIGRSAGAFYFEMKMLVSAGNRQSIGIGNASATLIGALGADANGIGYRPIGTIRTGNVDVQSGLASYGVGDVIGVLVNFATSQVQFRKNNVAQGVAQSFSAGSWYPMASSNLSDSVAIVVPPVYAPPTGYDWW